MSGGLFHAVHQSQAIKYNRKRSLTNDRAKNLDNCLSNSQALPTSSQNQKHLENGHINEERMAEVPLWRRDTEALVLVSHQAEFERVASHSSIGLGCSVRGLYCILSVLEGLHKWCAQLYGDVLYVSMNLQKFPKSKTGINAAQLRYALHHLLPNELVGIALCCNSPKGSLKRRLMLALNVGWFYLERDGAKVPGDRGLGSRTRMDLSKYDWNGLAISFKVPLSALMRTSGCGMAVYAESSNQIGPLRLHRQW